MEQQASIELKLWILTGSFAMMLAIVAFFLKRLLETFDRKTEKIMTQQDEHNKHIVMILATMGHHKEKIEWLERRIERK